MARVLIKPGVAFDTVDFGGYAILSALRSIAQHMSVDLVITSGTDGDHSGPRDPHKRGCAYDVRSHSFNAATKALILDALETVLGSRQFFYQLEHPGLPNEHFHIQVRKGMVYTVEDFLGADRPAPDPTLKA